ncbi:MULTISPECIES: sulfate permease [unclassified Streptomyces]|uniref:SulP family inorganic anion transporter n=1 Tax=unclassified Streptomyces TaxID=2593676 RepID=UPI000DC777D1|nr:MULTISPECIES: sulfate permease [unclassified Streptomyces]AWZ03463.1 sodium-independent anion transporter [Streptomyces sp. ICC4]AWZ11264.1 sodium-independent anion transporter [Streptomyces sp. ICC1]
MSTSGRPSQAPTGLRGYHRSWLGRDALAGVTVAAYLVPQVMAYAGVAGLPPVAGLWAVLPAMVLYALIGSSRLLSVGPESTTALMTAVAVGPLAAGDPGRYAVLAAALAVVVGLVSLAAWAVRLGFLAGLLSRPVLVGYLAGVALIMIIDQLPRLTGVRTTSSGFFPQLYSFVRHVPDVDWPTAGVAAAALALLLVAPKCWRTVPRPLLALVLATAAVAAFGLDDRYGISVIGSVPSGLPVPSLPPLGDLPRLLVPALGVLLVGYSDVILTARAFADRGDPVPLDPNRELLALGAANLGAGVLHGFPVSSSASRTALAQSSKARSQAYSLFAAVAVLMVLLFLGPLLAHTPSAVLGAIVVYAAVRLIEVAEFRRLAAFRRRELLLALGCLLGVLALGILYGVLVAVALSVVELLARVARPHDAVEGLVPGLAGMHDVDDYPTARTVPGLVVYRYDSPLFFANAEDFRRRALAAVDEQSRPVRWFVLNAEANVEVDITALDAVEALRQELVHRGIVFALARVKQELREDLDAFGLTTSVGAERIYPTLPMALGAYRAWSHEAGPAPE